MDIKKRLLLKNQRPERDPKLFMVLIFFFNQAKGVRERVRSTVAEKDKQRGERLVQWLRGTY